MLRLLTGRRWRWRCTEGTGNNLEQTLSGLTAGSSYQVKFFATHRRDAAGLNWGGALEELQVLIDGTEVWESTHPPDDFEAFSAAFTATSDTAVLKFNNNSPVRQSWLLDLSRCRSR